MAARRVVAIRGNLQAVRMRKTSVYLSEEDLARLARLARARGRSRAEVIPEGRAALERAEEPGRSFELAGVVSGDGTDISSIPEEELLRGFGDDPDR